MIRPFHLVLLPVIMTLVLLRLAWVEWKDFNRKASMAETFHRNSKIVHLKDVATSAGKERPYPIFEYEEGGAIREFAPNRNLILPPGGRVRLGPDPAPQGLSWDGDRSEIAIPLYGPDNEDTLYHQMFSSQRGADRTKPLLVTLAAFAAGGIGIFMKRQILWDTRAGGRRR